MRKHRSRYSVVKEKSFCECCGLPRRSPNWAKQPCPVGRRLLRSQRRELFGRG